MMQMLKLNDDNYVANLIDSIEQSIEQYNYTNIYIIFSSRSSVVCTVEDLIYLNKNLLGVKSEKDLLIINFDKIISVRLQ